MSEITITGNLVSDANLSYTPSGQAVANFRLARTERYRTNSGEWKDGDTLFIGVTCWRELAESAAELLKGSRVTVTGKLRTRTWDDDRFTDDQDNAAQRTIIEITADDVLTSVRGRRAERVTAASQGDGQDDTGEPPF
jgi:single-strand DNA-binding protein